MHVEFGRESASSTSCIAARLIVVLSLCALALARPGVSQAGINVWTSHGPYGGDCLRAGHRPDHAEHALRRDRDGGVFQSTNSGGSWSAVNTGLSGNALDVSALAIDPTTPSTLYAGTGGGGVFQSTNSGGSWSAVNTGLSGNALDVNALAIDPTTPSTLYAGTVWAASSRAPTAAAAGARSTPA